MSISETLLAPENLVLGNVQALVDQVDAAVQRGVKCLCLDVSRVTYIDSVALSKLVSLSSAMRNNDGVMLLADATDDIQTLFAMTKLDEIFFIKKRRTMSDEPEDDAPSLTLLR